MIKTKITVIATSYNDTAILLDYFKTITNQTLLPIEYILVDGGSTDDTVHLATKFQEDTGLPIRIVSGPRLNIAEGYNTGIKEAKTDVIVITGLGNRYANDFLEELVKCYEQGENQIVNGPIRGQDCNLFSYVYNRANFCGGNIPKFPKPSNHGVLIEKSVFKKIGCFYEHFVYAGEDAEFFMRAKQEGVKIGYTPKAKLYWDTPRNMKEYLKQKNAYYIGTVQWRGYDKKAARRSLAILSCIIIGVVFYWSPWMYLGVILFYLLNGYRIKSFHPLVMLFNVYSELLFLWLSVKHRKYLDEKYQMDKSKLM